MDSVTKYRADESRFLYYFYAKAAKNLGWPGVAEREKEKAIGRAYYEKELYDPRVKPFTATGAQKDPLVAAYRGRTVEGIGIKMGAYTVAVSDGKTPLSYPLLATDYLMDCNALVLVGEDPKNPSRKTVILAHVDVATDATKEIAKLVKVIPANYKISATLLGGPDNENYYTQTDILRALKQSLQVQEIRVNTQGARAVLVDVSSGKILIQNRAESIDEAYRIGMHEFPIATRIQFFDHQRDYPALRDVIWGVLEARQSPKAPYRRNATLFRVDVANGTLRKTEQTFATDYQANPRPDLTALAEKFTREVGMPTMLRCNAEGDMDIVVNGLPARRIWSPVNEKCK